MGITVSLHIPSGEQEQQIYSGDLIRFHVINLDFSPAIIILNWIENLWNTKYNLDKLHWSGKKLKLFIYLTTFHNPISFNGTNSRNQHKFGRICNLLKNYTFYCSLVFPGGSAGKESTCNAGDLGSIPGLGRSLEKGKATHSSILAWRIPRSV